VASSATGIRFDRALTIAALLALDALFVRAADPVCGEPVIGKLRSFVERVSHISRAIGIRAVERRRAAADRMEHGGRV